MSDPHEPQRQRSIIYTYTIFLYRLADGEFQGLVPAFPESRFHGRSLEHVRTVAADAIRSALEDLQKRGEEIPDDPDTGSTPFIEQMTVRL